MAETTRLELIDDTSAKFWQVTVDGAEVTTRWGRIGTDGRTKVTTEASEDAARASAAQQIAAKRKKGYAAAGSDEALRLAGARSESEEGGARPKTAEETGARPKTGGGGTRPKDAKRSDLARIKAWWKALGTDRFVPLPPPTRDRYTQGELHEDAAELPLGCRRGQLDLRRPS